MYTALGSPVELSQLTKWLHFADFPNFDPKYRHWIRVYQGGSRHLQFDYGKVSQVFNAQPALVPIERAEEILETNPWGNVPEFRFRGGGPVYSAEDGHYWDDGSKRSPTGVEVRRFLTDFEYDAPQIEPGFIDFHNLIEEKKNSYVTNDNFEPVTKFNEEKWRDMVFNSGNEYDDNIFYFDIDLGHLLDYLDERRCALIIAYFQSRKVTNLNKDLDLETVEKSRREHLDGPAVFDCRWVQEYTYPIGEIHWFCPIFPDTYSGSANARQEENRDVKFQTYRGHKFSPKEVLNEEGYQEKGFDRPVTPTDDIDELLSNYDWIFFDMAVLEKYVEAEEGTVSWGSRNLGQVSWKNKLSLRISRNSEHEVVIFLDELKSLYDTEVPHWKSYNRLPSGEVPEEAIISGAMGQFVESKSYSTKVFDAIEELDEVFQASFSASLFAPIEDENTKERVIMPPRNQKSQLLNSIDNLNMVFLERVNKDEVIDTLPEKRRDSVEGRKSALYELTAEQMGDTKASELFKPINAVYDLRIVADHRGQSKWERAMNALAIDPSTREYRDIYITLMTSLFESLQSIKKSLN